MRIPQRRSSRASFAQGLVILSVLAALVALALTAGDSAHAQTAVPAAPTGLTAPTDAHNSVTLSWDDPGDTSITGYRILRRDPVNQAPGVFSTIVSNTGSAATSYTDGTVAAKTRYVYRVKAINAAGLSGQSNYVNAETPAAPVSPSAPAKPTGLTASSVSHDSVTLSWDDPDDDSITGYRVLRRSRDGDAHGDGEGSAEFVAVIDDTGSPAASYTDTSVTARTRYVYRAKAINPAGLSERSSYVNVETLAEPVTTTVVVVPPEQPEEPEVALQQADISVPGGEVWDDNGVRRLRMFSTEMTVGSRTESGATYRGFASSSPVTIGSLASTDFDSGSWGCPHVSGGPNNGLCSSTFTEIYFETVGGTTTLLVRLSTTPTGGVPYGLAVRMPEATILFLNGVSFPVSHGTYAGTPGVCYENDDYCYPYGNTHSWRGVAAPTFSTGDVVTVWLYRPDLSQ